MSFRYYRFKAGTESVYELVRTSCNSALGIVSPDTSILAAADALHDSVNRILLALDTSTTIYQAAVPLLTQAISIGACEAVTSTEYFEDTAPVPASSGGSATTDASLLTAGTLSDARLSGNVVLSSSLSAVATSGAYSDLTGKPTIPAAVTTLPYSSITGTPTLATVATSGLASDLTGTLADARLSGNVALSTNIALAANSTASAFDVLDRRFVTSSLAATSGRVYFTFFTPVRSFTVSSIAFANGTAFSGLTLARFGIYTFDETTAALVARTASSTSTLGAVSSINTLSLDASDGYPATYTLNAGTRYGVAFLAVGTTMGNISAQVSANSALTNTSPRTSAMIQTYSDLPSSVTGFMVSATGQQFWSRLN